METKKLMIGNLLECDGVEIEIGKINENFISWNISKDKKTKIFNPFISITDKILKPIKITEKWLLNLGFTIENKPNGDIEYSYKEYRYTIIKKENYDGYLFCDDDIVLRDLDYIHELQNLYYALIGIEIKLKND